MTHSDCRRCAQADCRNIAANVRRDQRMRVWIPQGAQIFLFGTAPTCCRTHTRLGPHTTCSGTNITSSRTHTPSHRGLITRWQNTRIVKLTAHLHLTPRLRMRGAITPLSCPSTLGSAKFKTETLPLPCCSSYSILCLIFPVCPEKCLDTIVYSRPTATVLVLTIHSHLYISLDLT